MTPIEIFSKARRELISRSPWYGVQSIGLEIIEDSSCPTAWTDGKYLGINPEYIKSQSDEHNLFTVAHEQGHINLFQFDAPIGIDWNIWNIAADHVVNLMLKKSGFVIPKDALCDPRFEKMATFQVYKILKKEQEEKEKKNEQQRRNDENVDRDDQNRGCNKRDEDQSSKDRSTNIDSERDSLENDKYEDGEEVNHKYGEIRKPKNEDGSDLSESQKQEMIHNIEKNMVQAKMVSDKAGETPGNIEKLIKERLDPRPDACDYISRFVDQLAKTDVSWKRLNKRYLAQDIYLPTISGKRVGTIIFAFDTSGSLYCNPEALMKITGLLDMILERYDEIKIILIFCDYKFQGKLELTKDNIPISFEAKGGMGTRFKPVFDYIEEEMLDPVCLLYTTDGAGNMKELEEPFYPVLWVGSQDFKPPFGDFVRM